MAAKQFQFSWISMTFGSFEFKIEIMLQVEWEEEHFTIWLAQNIYQNLNCQVICMPI